MHSFTIASLATLATLASARIIPGGNASAFDCGVDSNHATSSFLNAISDLHTSSAKTAPRNAARSSSLIPHLLRRQNTPSAKLITVPTYIHVITKVASKNSVTPQMVTDQMTALNTAYSPYNIKFRLTNTTWTVNDAWAVAAGSDMSTLKQALRQGTYGALNLYFHSDLTGSILGTCTLPSDIGNGRVNPSVYVTDGCNVAAQTMPGGNINGYNKGMTAVHETGHWLGLLHVFEGYSCTGDGDFISDTPTQSTSTDGCPMNPPKDTCPGKGTDNVHNYMDYSTDACYEKFSAGQVARIRTLWAKFRNAR